MGYFFAARRTYTIPARAAPLETTHAATAALSATAPAGTGSHPGTLPLSSRHSNHLPISREPSWHRSLVPALPAIHLFYIFPPPV
jgi:hypothetical protein